MIVSSAGGTPHPLTETGNSAARLAAICLPLLDDDATVVGLQWREASRSFSATTGVFTV